MTPSPPRPDNLAACRPSTDGETREPGRGATYIHAPLSGFLVYLAQGWRLPFVVEPCIGHHSRWSVTLWRPDDA